MKLEEITKNITVFIDPLETSGCFIARIRGSLPSEELVKFDLELSGCYTDAILKDTVTAELEEILSCKYHYEIGDTDETELLYDGGNFI
jgi:hypothetical protein